MRYALGWVVACAMLGTFTTLVGPAKGVRPGNQFAIVVDQSGSMDYEKTSKAIAAALTISQQPTDDMEVCLYGFTDVCVQWKLGWKKLPDAAVSKAINSWGRDKYMLAPTRLIPAITHALKAKKSALTVVIISDGEFHMESKGSILAALSAGQKLRKRNKLPHAVVITICVGTKSDSKKLQALGEAGKGGCYLWKSKKKALPKGLSGK